LVFDLATGAFIARHEDALFLGPHPEPARVTGPRPSAKRPSSRVTGSSTAKPTPCSMISPKRLSTASAKTSWSPWSPCRCSSSMTSACASCP
jgi:hypothetical protein